MAQAGVQGQVFLATNMVSVRINEPSPALPPPAGCVRAALRHGHVSCWGVSAQFERAMIQERVRAGLARARGKGKRLGPPPLPAAKEAAIGAAPAVPGRPGVRVIAGRFKVNPSTVQRISVEMS